MVFISAHRHRQCKDLTGGVKAAYLAPYLKVPRSQIDYDGVTLNGFPEMDAYKFEIVNGSVLEQQQKDSDGGKYFEVSISITCNKISSFDNVEFQRLMAKDYFIIIEDNNGNFFLLGFRNGVIAETLNTTTTQYTMTFAGQEEDVAPYVTDLMGTTFKIIGQIDDYIFQNGKNYIFQDDTNYIFQ